MNLGDEGKERTTCEYQVSDLRKWVYSGAIYNIEKNLSEKQISLEGKQKWESTIFHFGQCYA